MIFTVQEMLQKAAYRTQNKEVFNFVNTYDGVLWKVLEKKFGIPDVLVNIVRSFYDNINV